MTAPKNRPASLYYVLAAALALALGGPQRAEAQADALRASAYTEVEAVEGSDADEEIEPALDDDDAGEITGRTFAGLGLGVGALVASTGIGLGIGMAIPHECTGASLICFQTHGLEGAFFGALAGTALLPAAYTLGTSLAGGRGHAGGSYLGFLVGAAAGAGMISLGVVANESLRNDAGAGLLGTSLALGIAAPLAGMVIGYELTDASAPPVVPTMAFDENGATFGVAGSF